MKFALRSRALPHLATALLALSAPACARRAPAPPVAAPPAGVAAAAADSARAPTPPRGEVRTASFWSPSLGATKRYVVWLPPVHADGAARRHPVAYYLHGLYGDETNWTERGNLAHALDSLVAAGMPPMIVVMPDGDDSWYTTWNRLVDVAACRRAPREEPAESYCVPWNRYDEYVARDLVAHVDSTYRTIPRREARGIAGLSMGGFGAVTLALGYPDVFAAAASHSGVLGPLYDGSQPFSPPPRHAEDIARVRELWRRFWPSMGPAFGSDMFGWWARDPARVARRARDAGRTMPRLRFDAGVDDRLVVDGNRAFHHELAALGIAHEWVERPGGHDWTYWRRESPHSLAWLAASLDSR